MSITLVIIGLLVGGVVAGRSLVHSVKRNQLISEIEKLRVVTASFQEKYDYLPSDLPNAYDYWGGACPSVESCNGDGDGIANPYRFTLQLFLAKLIPEGVYGTYYKMNYSANACARFLYSTLHGGSSNSFSFATFANCQSGPSNVISSQDAFAIDKKIDDGTAGGGRVRANQSGMGICKGTGTPFPYVPNSEVIGCRMEFFYD